MQGYVGVGIVKEIVRPVTEFEVEVDGQNVPILEAPLAKPEKVTHDADKPDLCEHLVRVDWVKTRPIDDAAWQTGLFTDQMPACKLHDRKTIEYLEASFGLDGEADSRAASIEELAK